MVLRKICLLVMLATGVSGSVNAQTYDPYKINRRAMALYQSGLNTATQGDYLQGIKLLQDAVKIEPRFLDAYLSIAGIYGEMKNYGLANLHYDKAKAIDSLYFKDYNLPYSINLAGAGDFEKALMAVNDFLSISNLNPDSRKAGEYRQKSYQFAINYLQNTDTLLYKFEPRNLGDSINSRVSEYYPTNTLDGQQLIYTRRVNNFNEDFYGSNRLATNWSSAEGLYGNINSNRNEGAQNISQDGQWLIFTGCNFPDGAGSCDLYISYHTADGWSAPENLGRRINTDAWESAPGLSPDKRDLYFASNRPGGYGGSDIYVSRRLSNGMWSEAENLGAAVNTAGDEGCPFMHADNQTLYFTSNGHLGFGGDD